MNWGSVPKRLRHSVYAHLMGKRPDNQMLAKLDSSGIVSIDMAKLDSVTEECAKDRRLLIDFVRRGASRSLLYLFFDISKRETARLRNEHNVATNGRPHAPTDEEREDVLAAWKAADSEGTEGMTLPQQILNLHDRFPEIHISALYAIVAENRSSVEKEF